MVCHHFLQIRQKIFSHLIYHVSLSPKRQQKTSRTCTEGTSYTKTQSMSILTTEIPPSFAPSCAPHQPCILLPSSSSSHPEIINVGLFFILSSLTFSFFSFYPPFLIIIVGNIIRCFSSIRAVIYVLYIFTSLPVAASVFWVQMLTLHVMWQRTFAWICTSALVFIYLSFADLFHRSCQVGYVQYIYTQSMLLRSLWLLLTHQEIRAWHQLCRNGGNLLLNLT